MESFGTLISENQWDTSFALKRLTGAAPIGCEGQNVQFLPKNLDIWGQKSIFCFGISIFVNKAYHQYTPG